MQATETTAEAPELPPSAEEPVLPLPAPEDRPRWGFTLGCAIAVGALFLVLGVLERQKPKLEPRAAPAPAAESASPDPFADLDPFAQESPLPGLVAQPLAPGLVAQPLAPSPALRPRMSPKVTQGPLTVSGRLPPEVISRIVRQNFGRLRLCYEAGLRNNPNLQGRIAVRFVIGRDGAMSTVSNGGSDLPDAGVIRCAFRALYGLSFPQPDSGIVTVSLPFYFRPS